MLMYMCKLHVKCQSHEFFDCLQLDCECLKLLLKLRIHHFKKFAPRENNPLYNYTVSGGLQPWTNSINTH